jgi:predicted TIM-barrel fold metal-dependent hydrolase
LHAGWKALLEKYPDRFMVGTDPVWKAHQVNRWYEADEGWKHYDKFISFHRKWLKELPADVEEKIRLENALAFFRSN